MKDSQRKSDTTVQLKEPLWLYVLVLLARGLFWCLKSLLLWVAAIVTTFVMAATFSIRWPLAVILDFSLFGIAVIALPIAIATRLKLVPEQARQSKGWKVLFFSKASRTLHSILFFVVVLSTVALHLYAEDATQHAKSLLDYRDMVDVTVYDGVQIVEVGDGADEVARKLRSGGFGECVDGAEADLSKLTPRIFCRRDGVLAVKSFAPFADYAFKLNRKTDKVISIESAGQKMDEARIPSRESSTVNIDSDGNTIERVRYELMLGRDIDINSLAVKFFIEIEDRRFFNHGGNDWWGILRAIYRVPFSLFSDHESPQGGSTITEQTAKLAYLGNENKLLRRVKSLFLAESLERRLTKHEILQLWLNRSVMGLERPTENRAERRFSQQQESILGFKTSARVLFNKRIEKCMPNELAMLAILPRSPEILSTLKKGGELNIAGNKNHQKLDDRRKRALEIFAEKLDATAHKKEAARFRAAIDEPLRFAFNEDDLMGDESLIKLLEEQPDLISSLPNNPSSANGRRGIVIITTIDKEFQRATSRMIQAELPDIKKQLMKLTNAGTQNTSRQNAFEVLVDVVAMSVQGGELLAFSSSKTHNNVAIPNRSNVNSRSFAGSPAKALILAYGFGEGVITPHTIIRANECVAPNGFRFDGPADNRPLPLSNHLSASRNSPFICVANKLGIDNVLAKWREIFPKCKLPDTGFVPEAYDLVRGVNRPEAELTPTELAEGYTALAGNGIQQSLRVVEAVYVDGKQFPITVPAGRQVFKPAAAALTASLLRETTKGLTNWRPTPNYDLALKTGSTSHSYIVVLFSPKLVLVLRYLIVPAEKLDAKAAVAFSKDISRRFKGVFAGKLVKPFADSILKVIKEKRLSWLRGTFTHENIISLRVDPLRDCATDDGSGVSADYIRGTEPPPCTFEGDDPEAFAP